MSHDGSWRAACLNRQLIPIPHFETPSVARGVTATGVGSGALFGLFSLSVEISFHSAFDDRPTLPIQATDQSRSENRRYNTSA
jgi:hypothetical protein